MDDAVKQLVRDYQATFDTPHGKKVFEDLQEQSGFNGRIRPGSNPADTGFDLGQRDLFLYIKDKVDTILHIKEAENTEEYEMPEVLGSEVEDAPDIERT